MNYASKHDYFDSTSGASNLNSGDGVWIHTVLVTNTSGSVAEVDFLQSDKTGVGDGSTVVTTIVSGNNDSEDTIYCAPFDEGFRIPALASGVTVTVTWRPTG